MVAVVCVMRLAGPQDDLEGLGCHPYDLLHDAPYQTPEPVAVALCTACILDELLEDLDPLTNLPLLDAEELDLGGGSGDLALSAFAAVVLRPEVLGITAEVQGGEIDQVPVDGEDGNGAGLVEGDGEDEVIVRDAVEGVYLDGERLLDRLVVDLGAGQRPRGDNLGAVVLIDGVAAGAAVFRAQGLAIDLDV